MVRVVPETGSAPDEEQGAADATTAPEGAAAFPITIRAVQCSGGSDSFGELADALPPTSDHALQNFAAFWEKMASSRPAGDPRSMHHPRAMRHVFVGTSGGVVDFRMTKDAGSGGEDGGETQAAPGGKGG